MSPKGAVDPPVLSTGMSLTAADLVRLALLALVLGLLYLIFHRLAAPVAWKPEKDISSTLVCQAATIAFTALEVGMNSVERIQFNAEVDHEEDRLAGRIEGTNPWFGSWMVGVVLQTRNWSTGLTKSDHCGSREQLRY